ncbi:MAG: HAD-IIA family hydrolase [Methanophagales archaeon ANME-1-THS]|nr:MAG: HAD-IIA family hydrolase [Methanophagales archaeon ANME-1-THS]
MELKALVVDLDGSVYHGDQLIEKADEALNLLQKSYKILYLTNNSTGTRADFARKLEHLGIPCQKDQIISSGYAAARYLKEQYEGSSVYLIGEHGLKQELLEEGLHLCATGPCDIVLIGLDNDFNYEKMNIALSHLLKGAILIATNTDPVLITKGAIVPGAGALVASIEAASGKKAMVTGKPSAFITDLIVTTLRVKPHEILIIGDNLQTDILMGIKSGMRTALVLTGVSKLSDIEHFQIRPDYIFKSIAEVPLRLAEGRDNQSSSPLSDEKGRESSVEK